MVLETSVPYRHLTWLIARENFVEFSHRESWNCISHLDIPIYQVTHVEYKNAKINQCVVSYALHMVKFLVGTYSTVNRKQICCDIFSPWNCSTCRILGYIIKATQASGIWRYTVYQIDAVFDRM